MGLLRTAFNALTRVHSHEAMLKRLNKSDEEVTTIRITPSNYFRYLQGPSATVVHGREFIIPADSIANPFTPIIKRGDRIYDPTYGAMAITEIIEVVDVGGSVMGYRCRCD